MNNENKKVESWVNKRQTHCQYIHWKRIECNAVKPICLHAERNGEKCVYKYCPLK